MSKTFYSIQIDTISDNFEKIGSLLNIQRNENKSYWTYEMVHGDTSLDIKEGTVISHFLNILEGNYSRLLDLGIRGSDITFWITYEYDDQCNMEFHPEDTKRLDENGITLCVSCYQYDDQV